MSDAVECPSCLGQGGGNRGPADICLFCGGKAEVSRRDADVYVSMRKTGASHDLTIASFVALPNDASSEDVGRAFAGLLEQEGTPE